MPLISPVTSQIYMMSKSCESALMRFDLIARLHSHSHVCWLIYFADVKPQASRPEDLEYVGGFSRALAERRQAAIEEEPSVA